MSRSLHPVKALLFWFFVCVQIGKVVSVKEAIHDRANRYQHRNEYREEDADRIVRAEVDRTEDDQTDELDEGEEMNRSRRNSSCVVVDRVKCRVHQPVSKSFNELDPPERHESHEQEDPVQGSHWDVPEKRKHE